MLCQFRSNCSRVKLNREPLIHFLQFQFSHILLVLLLYEINLQERTAFHSGPFRAYKMKSLFHKTFYPLVCLEIFMNSSGRFDRIIKVFDVWLYDTINLLNYAWMPVLIFFIHHLRWIIFIKINLWRIFVIRQKNVIVCKKYYFRV